MGKYNFIVDMDIGIVTWEYIDNKYNLNINGLKNARIIGEEYIYIKNLTQDNKIQNQYYSFKGILLLAFIEESGLVYWQNNNNRMELVIDQLLEAEVYENYKIIIILKGKERVECRMMVYSIEGKLLYELEEPEHYHFGYLTFDGDKPAIVCEGDGSKNTKDSYGRTTWKFLIDPIKGELKRISLAY